MKLETIDLPITTGMPWLTPVVEAEIVDVAPHLANATFAVHRSRESMSQWQVSHVETGLRISPNYSTRAMAIKKAEIALRKRTQAEYDAATRTAHSLMPWMGGSLDWIA